MSLFSIFSISSSGMMAQSVRMNTIASNMANANNMSGDKADVYKAKVPVFQTILSETNSHDGASFGVRVLRIAENQAEPTKVYEPNNPLSNKDGYLYKTNVNPIEEMANMISASRTFQNNIEVMNSTKQLLTSLLRLGQ